VRAYLLDSSVDAGDDIVLTATSAQHINAGTGAGSAAIVAGLVAGAASGTGASVTNRITTDVQAYIDGSGADGVIGDNVLLTAQDESSIKATTASASLAAAIGVFSAAVSIGVSLAENRVDNAVEAKIADAASVESRTGDVRLTADEKSTIQSAAVAVSVAVGAGGFGFGLSGAGAHAQNVILGSTEAHISGSVVDSAGAVDIDASNTADIDATIVAVSVAGAGGSGGGVAAAIGVSLAENLIGWDPDVSTPATYTTADNPTQVSTNETVKITAGVGAGRVYRYIGSSP
jgi:hypothetical protein